MVSMTKACYCQCDRMCWNAYYYFLITKLHAILACEGSITAFYGQIITAKLYIWPLSLAKPMSYTAFLYVFKNI